MAAPSSLAHAPSYAGPWRSLKTPLLPWVAETITETLNFAQMTPVQAAAIPLFLSHKDVIVEAVTGSGKTLAYLVPLLHMLLRRESPLKQHQVGAIVLVPTRELATQVHGVLQTFLEAQPLSGADGDAEDDEAMAEAGEGSGSDAEPTSRPAARRAPLIRIPPAQLVVGGTKSTPQDDYTGFRARSPHILIGTPGRMAQLLQRRGVDKAELDLLILDEADRLLDANFGPTLKQILAVLPKQRRTGLFSATMTDALGELVRIGLRNPVRVVVKVAQKAEVGGKTAGSKKGKEKASDAALASDGTQRIPAGLQNFYHVSRAEHKLSQMLRIIAYESGCAQRPKAGQGEGSSSADGFQARKFIVYFATCAQVNYFYKLLSRLPELKKQNIQLFSLHGKQTPARRTATFSSFVSATPTPTKANGGAAAVLLCTDVAARGLDMPDVDVVVQFDPPTDPKVFSHRCGRTARAGRAGRAIVMLVGSAEESSVPEAGAGGTEAAGAVSVEKEGRKAGKGEEDYVEFLRIRKIPLKPYPYLVTDPATKLTHPGPEPSRSPPAAPFEPADKTAHTLSQQLRKLVLADRELYELSLRAFVSFVRAYGKHEASFIFRVREVVCREVGAWCLGWGMVRVPKMPELQGAGLEDGAAFAEVGFEQANVDLRTFAFLDKAREKQRLAALAEKDAQNVVGKKTSSADPAAKEKVRKRDNAGHPFSDAGSGPDPESSSRSSSDEDEDSDDSADAGAPTTKKRRVKKDAWSNQKDRKAVRELRRLKKARKRDYLKRTAAAAAAAATATASSSGDPTTADDGVAPAPWKKGAGGGGGGIGISSRPDGQAEEAEGADWEEDVRETKRARVEASQREAAEASEFFSGL